MRPVSYSRVSDVATAIGAVTADPTSAFLAGGTTEIDMLRIYVEQPARLVDINDLPIADIEEMPAGRLRIGALARMSAVAENSAVRRLAPLVSESLLLGASAQLRNMASIGGNLMQRVRCAYFRDVSTPCNRRSPGSGCSAIGGFNRGHAVLGTSDHCIATHPSDLAVALVALDADVITQGPGGGHRIPVDDFFLLPEETPDVEHPIDRGELIVAIELPQAPLGAGFRYLKVRDRESYEFALASVAVALAVRDGAVEHVRLALGGVATKPWRARRAERVLTGAAATTENFAAAAREELAPAVAHGMNGFKIELAQRTMVRALQSVLDSGERP